jgi:hypothetical protein
MRIAMVAALGLLAVAASARADVAFSDFGPGDTFNTTTGLSIFGSGAFSGALGMATNEAEFTSAASGSLTSVEVAVGYDGGPNSFTVTLYADNAGSPGTALESFSLTNAPAFGTSFTPETFTSVSLPTLTAGTSYWLGVAASDPNSSTDGAWNFNSMGALGTDVRPPNAPATSTTLPAFAVNVTAVPEPSSLALGLVGVAGAVGYGWRRRNVAA